MPISSSGRATAHRWVAGRAASVLMVALAFSLAPRTTAFGAARSAVFMVALTFSRAPRATPRGASRSAVDHSACSSARRSVGHSARSSARRSVLAAALAAVLVLPVAGPAQAQEAFRFWGYYAWQGGEWTFAPTGPDQTRPADGAVEGWRFAVSGAEGSARVPRATGDFAAICGSAPPPSGQKRVAVVIDYGVAAEAPQGETPPEARGACAVVAANATGLVALRAVASVRLENGLVCGLDGYPRTECAAPYDGPLPNPTASEPPVQLRLPAAQTAAAAGGSESDDDFPVGVAIAAALVLVVGAGALIVSRRRSSSP